MADYLTDALSVELSSQLGEMETAIESLDAQLDGVKASLAASEARCAQLVEDAM